MVGLPVPDVSWFKDGQPLEVERIDEQTFRFQVDGTTSPDYGEVSAGHYVKVSGDLKYVCVCVPM